MNRDPRRKAAARGGARGAAGGTLRENAAAGAGRTRVASRDGERRGNIGEAAYEARPARGTTVLRPDRWEFDWRSRAIGGKIRP
jgi:hypothetical protein